jgi:hypothetical protein
VAVEVDVSEVNLSRAAPLAAPNRFPKVTQAIPEIILNGCAEGDTLARF